MYPQPNNSKQVIEEQLRAQLDEARMTLDSSDEKRRDLAWKCVRNGITPDAMESLLWAEYHHRHALQRFRMALRQFSAFVISGDIGQSRSTSQSRYRARNAGPVACKQVRNRSEC